MSRKAAFHNLGCKVNSYGNGCNVTGIKEQKAMKLCLLKKKQIFIL